MKVLNPPGRLVPWLLLIFFCLTVSVSAKEDQPFKAEVHHEP